MPALLLYWQVRLLYICIVYRRDKLSKWPTSYRAIGIVLLGLLGHIYICMLCAHAGKS